MDELLFDPLAGPGEPMTPAMALALQASFGSEAGWRESLHATAAPAPGGTVVLAFDARRGVLVHRRAGALAPDDVPLLAIRCAVLANASLDALRWGPVYERYQAAVDAATPAFGAGQDEIGQARLLDVRRAGVYEKAEAMLPGAEWKDPAEVGAWAQALDRSKPVVVYCVYGHEVGRVTALRLRAAGVDARYLRGGIDGWQSAGRPVVPRPAANARQPSAS